MPSEARPQKFQLHDCYNLSKLPFAIDVMQNSGVRVPNTVLLEYRVPYTGVRNTDKNTRNTAYQKENKKINKSNQQETNITRSLIIFIFGLKRK